jgi:ATP-binding protein involved in chromosome partitioning
MSGYHCQCGERHELFGHGGGRELAQELSIPLLAEIALSPGIGAGGDTGEPSVLDEDVEGAFRTLARLVLTEIAPPAGAQGCTARMLDAIDRAVALH